VVKPPKEIVAPSGIRAAAERRSIIFPGMGILLRRVLF
jgi:hypothetical protein